MSARITQNSIWLLAIVPVLFTTGCHSFRSGAVENQIAKARNLTFHGLNALHLGRTDQAQQLLDQAAHVCPTDQRIRQHLASALVDQGQIDRAIEQLHVGIRHAPSEPTLYVELGDLYLKKHQPHLALESADKALEHNRGLASAWLLKGRSLRAQDDPVGALSSFHRAASFSDNASEIHLEIAKTYSLLGKPMRALTSLEICAQQFAPDQIPVEVVLLTGKTLADLKNYRRAIDILAEGVRRHDAIPEMWIALSQSQLRSGDRSSARLTALSAAKKFPSDTSVISWSTAFTQTTDQKLQAANDLR